MRFVVVCGVALAAMSTVAFAQDAGDDYIAPESYAAASENNDGGTSDNADSGWAYDWAGSYLGVSAAVAMGSQDTIGIGNIDTGSRDLSGTALGGYVGQNYQLTRIVLGTEMDFSKSDISGSFDLPGSLVACNGAGFSCGTDVTWYGTFRGRAGLATGDFLPYATAGLAVGGVNSSFKGPGVDTNVSGLGVGWVLGAGLEYAVMKNLNVRAEALHFDLSDVSDTVLGTKVTTDTQFSVLRAGVSLKF